MALQIVNTLVTAPFFSSAKNVISNLVIGDEFFTMLGADI
jgi:hypothetical protein